MLRVSAPTAATVVSASSFALTAVTPLVSLERIDSRTARSGDVRTLEACTRPLASPRKVRRVDAMQSPSALAFSRVRSAWNVERAAEHASVAAAVVEVDGDGDGVAA